MPKSRIFILKRCHQMLPEFSGTHDYYRSYFQSHISPILRTQHNAQQFFWNYFIIGILDPRDISGIGCLCIPVIGAVIPALVYRLISLPSCNIDANDLPHRGVCNSITVSYLALRMNQKLRSRGLANFLGIGITKSDEVEQKTKRQRVVSLILSLLPVKSSSDIS